MSTLLFIWFFVCVLSILLIVLMLLPGDTWQTLCHCQLDLTLQDDAASLCQEPHKRHVPGQKQNLATWFRPRQFLQYLRANTTLSLCSTVMNTVANLTDFTLAHIHYYVTARNILKEKISKRKKGAIKGIVC